ncbi:hypothetical protein BDV36DRAFT_252745 [Aspergillus pseudocaelatus]|uniref:Uncharacterized protein n=1 Tax=Aspergillus pseudocaelatus TaxID=1825620 RepID=A0ABQ6WPG5_9EURO|nr:hypothetical protein BDV36DRAFT_252745 [Aspergillus pseudocaelatus]
MSARLMSRGPGSVLRPLLETWQNNVSQGWPLLGLQPAWKGVKAAASCLKFQTCNRFQRKLSRRIKGDQKTGSEINEVG